MTEHQELWWKRFKTLMRGMPVGIELIVRHGNIGVAKAGTLLKYFDETGHIDNVPDLDSLTSPRVHPNSESM